MGFGFLLKEFSTSQIFMFREPVFGISYFEDVYWNSCIEKFYFKPHCVDLICDLLV